MVPSDFLKHVLPGKGVYCAFIGKRNRFFSTIELLSEAVLAADSKNVPTYYAVASFRDGSSRKQANVLNIKAIAADIDCGPGKHYPSKKAGAEALLGAITKLSLPSPTLVDSGNGLHAYWTLTRPLPNLSLIHI